MGNPDITTVYLSPEYIASFVLKVSSPEQAIGELIMNDHAHLLGRARLGSGKIV